MIFTFQNCGGCNSCALACSFRLHGAFDAKSAAIEVNEKETGGYEVILHEIDSGRKTTCDGCVDQEEPMCVKYCHDAKELMEHIERFRKSFIGKEETQHG